MDFLQSGLRALRRCRRVADFLKPLPPMGIAKPSVVPLFHFDYKRHYSELCSNRHDRFVLHDEHVAELKRVMKDYNRARERRFPALTMSDIVNAALNFAFEHPVALARLGQPEEYRDALAREVCGRPSFTSPSMTCSKLIGLLVLLAATASAQAPGGASFRDKGKNPPARWRGVTQKTASRTNCSVPTGFTFPVRLENAVYSYNVETPAIAVVEKDIVYSDEVKFSAMALSLDGSAGLKGTVETHKDAAVANTVLRSIVSGTSAALDAMGVSPMASQATQGLTQEAVKELDTERQQVTASITVEAETGLRVYIPQRLEY